MTLFFEILECLLPYIVNTNDLLSLSLTNKNIHQYIEINCQDKVYQTSFKDNDIELDILRTERFPELQNDWKKLYKKRKEGQLFTWGQITSGRLGYTRRHLNPANDNTNIMIRNFILGSNKPHPVPFGAGTTNKPIITDISAGGFSFQFITSDGNLYTTGETYHGGNKSCGPQLGTSLDYGSVESLVSLSNINIWSLYNLYNTGSRTNISPPNNLYNNDITNINSVLNETLDGNKFVKRMVTREALPEIYDNQNTTLEPRFIKFVKVSSGRAHFLALGEDAELYSWDDPDVVQGIRMKFPHNNFKNPILSFECGWNFNCCYKFGIGLCIWKHRRSVTPYDKFFAYCDYKIIPDTVDNIQNYTCLQDGIVCFVKGNELYMYNDNEEHVFKLKTSILGYKQINKVKSGRMNIAIFTNNDEELYIGKINTSRNELQDLKPVSIPNAHNSDEKFVEVSFGDYHILGLSNKGKIYSWGLESQFCGCLGLGMLDFDVPSAIVTLGSRDIRVPEPTQVSITDNMDYTCIKIAAGGWQSSAIII
ncbi:uncharacterized protein SCODWIG_00372 [Saccharomycodes ludwigii]|uniref:SCF-associated factor 1 n=1 Tax=Saccharomycodes ludwigii TaxID=36035 RepID=A0A376B1T0_9ASCO|nr:uncharacterized protein SCODWIG_00372 [Saccharomycodes ludwigii]